MTVNTFLPTRNKFVYSWSIKIHASGFSKLLESIFCFLPVAKAFSLQKVVKMLEEVVVSLQGVRWNMTDEAKLCSPVLSTFAACTAFGCTLCSRHCHGELGPFCRPTPLQALQFSVDLISLLGILLRCNGFAGI